MMNGLQLLSEGKAWAYRDKVFFTDPPGSPRIDAVLPIGHENIILAEHMYIPDGATVLDLCTGSGVLAIFAADKASKVVGTDINPRALEFAKFNAQLNGVDQKIEWKLGSLFAPVRGMKFDTILANPPFEPTPKEWMNYLHSDGGEDGLTVVRQILAQISDHMSPSGCFHMIIWVTESSLYILDEIKSVFCAERVTIRFLGEFSLQAYRAQQMKRSELLGGPLTVALPQTTESVHYLCIQITADGEASNKLAEVSSDEKAIQVTGSIL